MTEKIATVLPIALDASVMIRVAELKRNGGPTDLDISSAGEVSQLLAEKSDVMMFGGKKKGEAASVFNRLAFAVAVMAFCPGGVTVFGHHYEEKV